MSKYCPHCEEEITSLNYSVSATSYGDYYFENEEHQRDECEEDCYSNYYYTCPCCGEEVEPEDLLESTEEDEDEDNENTSKPEPPVNIKQSEMSTPISENNLRVVRCPECGIYVDFDHGEDTVECPKCNLVLNTKYEDKKFPF